MKNIESIRAEIEQFFNPDSEILETEVIISPSGHFRVKTNSYKQSATDRNWEVTKVDVFEVINERALYFHSLLMKAPFIIHG
jgi:hypothetical protein